MHILGIETSCDETAVSIIETTGQIKVLANVVSSQVKLHAHWGGVVPNLAAREHLKNLPLVFRSALRKAKLTPGDIDLLAVTQGPGLIPALLIGTNFARALAFAWKKPLLGIHHIEGHIYANFIGVNSNDQETSNKKINTSNIKFPLLALVVSGGHTQLILMKRHLHYQIVGETLDDAAGEAFDKVARILGLGYPGGPAIAKMAMEVSISKSQFPKKLSNKNSKIENFVSRINLPRPMLKSNDLNFSFSGLKTAVLYETKKNPGLLKNKHYIAAVASEFQQAVVDVLISKTIRAARKYNPATIILAGGVSANRELRQRLGEEITQQLPAISYIIPDFSYSLDNAAMIAAAAHFRYQKMNKQQRKKLLMSWKNIQANASLSLQ